MPTFFAGCTDPIDCQWMQMKRQRWASDYCGHSSLYIRFSVPFASVESEFVRSKVKRESDRPNERGNECCATRKDNTTRLHGRSAGLQGAREAESSLLRSAPLLSALCGGVARALRRARPRQGRRRRRLCRRCPQAVLRGPRFSLLRPSDRWRRTEEREREWEKAATAGDGWSEEDEDEQPVSPHEGRTPPPSRPTVPPCTSVLP